MIVVARIKVQSGREAEAEAAFRRLIDHVTREEPGTLEYRMNRSRKDPTVFVFVERYENPAAFDRHGKSAAMQELFRTLQPVLDGAPVIDVLDEIAAKPAG
jgi:quinol monooxygenase YgiN